MHKQLFLKLNSCYANIHVSSWNISIPTITNFVHLLRNKFGIFSLYKKISNNNHLFLYVLGPVLTEGEKVKQMSINIGKYMKSE
jgi:hypothetical protein